MIGTPDCDIYVEELTGGNPDFLRFWHVSDGAFPPRVPRNQIYDFQPMTPQEYGRLVHRGEVLGQAERASRGLVGPAAPPAAPVPPAGGGQAPAPQAGAGLADEWLWVLAENVRGLKKYKFLVTPPEKMIMPWFILPMMLV